ncbi:MAG: DsbE family thiol:disulfide interchange protein [Caulobacterales bacterium]|nr:DsbE family thiol:disulfide interchange protein [Caulobacterales bacterium]
MKRFLFLVPALLFAGLLVAFGIGLTMDPTILPSMLIGKPVPAFNLAPVRPGDQGLARADLGGEPVLLNYYASWCVACRAEHPMLMRLRSEGVPIHGVDWKDAPADGDKWLQDRGDPYIRVGNDQSGRTGIDMGVSGVPETFVIDKQGRVRYRHVGAITQDDWANKIAPLMQRLKAES